MTIFEQEKRDYLHYINDIIESKEEHYRLYKNAYDKADKIKDKDFDFFVAGPQLFTSKVINNIEVLLDVDECKSPEEYIEYYANNRLFSIGYDYNVEKALSRSDFSRYEDLYYQVGAVYCNIKNDKCTFKIISKYLNDGSRLAFEHDKSSRKESGCKQIKPKYDNYVKEAISLFRLLYH